MAEIIIVEKPENISYGQIKELLRKAHQINYDRGIIFKTMTLSAEELEERIRQKNGKTFVALDGDTLVGTASCYPLQSIHWCHHGLMMKLMFVGVLPEYKGQHIYARLLGAVEQETLARGLEVVSFDTAEKNVEMQRASKKAGFVHVAYYVPESNHYSVIMMKWLNGCPHSSLKCRSKFIKQKIKKRWKYKPGKVPRF